MPALAAWENFYVIVGSSAAALVGLQFIVMALIADVRAPATGHSTSAFGTPTVVHFCAVLLIAAIMTAPWPSITAASLAMDAHGVLGIGYTLVVLRRARAQTDYRPVLEDWVWHTIFPFVGYGALVVASILVGAHGAPCLFAIGGAALILLFVGIHNAWDTVTYVVVDRKDRDKAQGKG